MIISYHMQLSPPGLPIRQLQPPVIIYGAIAHSGSVARDALM